MYICISVIKIIVTILVIIGDKWYVFIANRYKTYFTNIFKNKTTLLKL